MTRHLDLAGLLAGAGRYADADAVLREGLLVYPHSSVLRELRQSMSLLATAEGLSGLSFCARTPISDRAAPETGTERSEST